ncbi:general stress protein (plasmid) [Bacillus mycoides]|uniref:NAD(P)H-dependent oxidoreductase n=1 Tax=Bacillus mycoides TaxID=1405 RepID=UPI0008162F78|nr:NAD(P)H-dependent oxidoreductase [Bacillus mycoides]QWG36543.1 general stress protein [Bacillus mycoides]QWG47956.1 general stress protein [Bacillus mycoides]QWH15092.1 general stress protein [Bacillus mycoides]SCC63261.1 General stress protein 14 [Bacillus mycoides]
MKTMLIVAHPNLGISRANARILALVKERSDFTVHDLYLTYPDWNIDIKREQQLLLEHDRIVILFPLHWYSVPAMLQKWLEDVIEFGWAFGPGGDKLKDKEFILAITTGGAREYYQKDGINLFPVEELIRPFEVTIHRVQGKYTLLNVLYGVKYLSDQELDQETASFAESLLA